MLDMNFRFSLKVTISCLVLATGMTSLSIWQWGRHLQKQELIQELERILLLEPIPLRELVNQKPDWANLTFRRVSLSGTFDFKHEILLRNRSLNKRAGSHVITPLKLDGPGELYVLVDRGFLPLGREEAEQRLIYQHPEHTEIFALIKGSMPQKLFAPQDPEVAPGKPWVDGWLRIDIPNIKKQLPYELLPVYLETMDNPNDPLLVSKIVRKGDAGRDDILNLSGKSNVENFGMDSPDAAYPIPTFDTTPPPDIHLGYVYEWAFMALLTISIGLIMQFKRPGTSKTSQRNASL